MIKKILLVNPPLSGEERFGSLADGGFAMPPLGLAILASTLRLKGFQPQILDCEALQLRAEDAFRKILEINPDIVGFTATTVAIHNAVALGELLKERTALPTVIGGVHVSSLPEDTLERFPSFDYGVFGEGEETFPEMLEHLNGTAGLSGVQGVLYRENGKVVKNPRRPFLRNLDDLPYPAWDLLPELAAHYRPPVFMYQRLPSMSIMTSRGCPGHCTFCNSSLFGSRVRFHSVDYVMGMIEELVYRYGIRDIQVYDDTFVVNRPRLQEFCRRLMDMKIKVGWSANARVDCVDPEMLGLMKKAGCFILSFGIESGDPRILKEIKKGITLEQVEQALTWTKDAGIMSKGYLMFGNVGETQESLETTQRFVLKLPVDLITTTFFTPLPGSEDYERATQFGRFDNDWRNMSEYTPVFVPQGLTEEKIRSARVRLTRAFYLRPKLFTWFLSLLFKPSHFRQVIQGGWMFLKFSLLGGRKTPRDSHSQPRGGGH